MKNLNLTDEQYKTLLRWIDDGDYCYLCDNHPSSGHSRDCPLFEVDEEEEIIEETQIAIDNGVLRLQWRASAAEKLLAEIVKKEEKK